MKDLKNNLIEFEIDTVDKLVNYFITCYEYSFTIPFFKENKIKPRDLFLGYAESLKHVTDLEKLWYGLELKYALFVLNEFPLTFAKASIKKTLKDINSIDIEVLKLHSETFSNIVLDERLKGLILRPTLLINDENESLFNPMLDTVEEVYNFIDKYRKHIAVTKVNKFRVLPAKITDEYIDKDMIIVELWSLLVQGYFTDKLYPTVQAELQKEHQKIEEGFDDDDLISVLENYKEEYDDEEELTEEEFNELYNSIMDSIDELFDDDIEDEEELEEGSMYVDININQEEILELTGTIIEAVFKKTGISDELLTKMFEELISINLRTLSNMLSCNLNSF